MTGNPLRKWIIGTWVVLGLSIIGAIPLLNAGSLALGVILGTLALSCLICLPIFYYTGRSYRKGVEELLSGNYWARWTYDPAQWQAFTESEWVRGKRTATKMALWSLGVGVVSGVALGLWLGEFLVFLGSFGGIGAVLALVLGGGTFLSEKYAYNKRRQSVGEVYIGPRGLYQNGIYHTWQGFGISLQGVVLRPGSPAVLEFSIRQQSTEGSITREVRVPIPFGQEEEAVQLVQRFHGSASA